MNVSVDVEKTNLLAITRSVFQLSTVVTDMLTVPIPAMKMMTCAKVMLVHIVYTC